MMHRTFFHAAVWESVLSSAWLREAWVRHTNSYCFSKDTPRTCGRNGNKKVLSGSVLHLHKHSLSIQIALDERYIKAYFQLQLSEIVLNLLGECKQWDMIQVSKSPSSYSLSFSLTLVGFTGKPFLEVMSSIPISRFWILNAFLLFSNKTLPVSTLTLKICKLAKDTKRIMNHQLLFTLATLYKCWY